ncbi:DinB family protein [Flavobacterium sp. LC2016-01]|uniref:DinB family protein n=1 Tax=Flavobacterium sp. LC2016-01 TaxID=2675876 RepID=UPI0012BACFE0|nr:DinB family protein [Flavobacterium sp. LC2016-01]MTH15965.1 DinB family protein [Flavobacterium sp. LC2016-01]
MKTAVQKNIVETYLKLNEILSSFSEEELNQIPYQGSWTAGQTAQHIILACSGFPKLFAGKTKKTIRKYDDNVLQLDAIFLDFSTKMNAPDFLIPEKKEYDKNQLTSSLKKIESELFESAEKYDLTLTCLDFNVPGFEHFTIFEWIHFALVHTQRHTYQLNSILKTLTKV